ncbi:MAG: hypothetical protein QOH62_89 [Solirubrobacteraceae bacterium]|jgi:hypothetical protein|nr:hypothetical protein [Solirubrobacteraceae bacterium]
MEIALEILAIWTACSLVLAVSLSAVMKHARVLRSQRVPVARESIRARL